MSTIWPCVSFLQDLQGCLSIWGALGTSIGSCYFQRENVETVGEDPRNVYIPWCNCYIWVFFEEYDIMFQEQLLGYSRKLTHLSFLVFGSVFVEGSLNHNRTTTLPLNACPELSRLMQEACSKEPYRPEDHQFTSATWWEKKISPGVIPNRVWVTMQAKKICMRVFFQTLRRANCAHCLQ